MKKKTINDANRYPQRFHAFHWLYRRILLKSLGMDVGFTKKTNINTMGKNSSFQGKDSKRKRYKSMQLIIQSQVILPLRQASTRRSETIYNVTSKCTFKSNYIMLLVLKNSPSWPHHFKALQNYEIFNGYDLNIRTDIKLHKHAHDSDPMSTHTHARNIYTSPKSFRKEEAHYY